MSNVLYRLPYQFNPWLSREWPPYEGEGDMTQEQADAQGEAPPHKTASTPTESQAHGEFLVEVTPD